MRFSTFLVMALTMAFCQAALGQSITITSPAIGDYVDVAALGEDIEVLFTYTGTLVDPQLHVNGDNIGFTCTWSAGSGSCFFTTSPLDCAPVIQYKARFVPGGTRYSSTVQFYTYDSATPASLACLPEPPPEVECVTGANVGGPINVVTGNMFYEADDVFVPSPLPIRLARRYDSRSTFTGAFGVGFRHAYEARLESLSGFGTRRKLTNSANRWNFCGLNAELKWYCLGTFSMVGDTVTEPDGTKHVFSGEKLDYIEDRWGNRLTFAYSGPLLMSITDTFGRVVSFAYVPATSLRERTVPELASGL